MEYKGTFKVYENQPKDLAPFRSILFAHLSSRLGNCVGITIDTKVENGCNTFGIGFPENKEDAIKSALNYINEYLYEIKYNAVSDKNYCL